MVHSGGFTKLLLRLEGRVGASQGPACGTSDGHQGKHLLQRDSQPGNSSRGHANETPQIKT